MALQQLCAPVEDGVLIAGLISIAEAAGICPAASFFVLAMHGRPCRRLSGRSSRMVEWCGRVVIWFEMVAFVPFCSVCRVRAALREALKEEHLI